MKALRIFWAPLLLSAHVCLATNALAAPDTIYLGGPILTMDRNLPQVEAIAITGDRITMVGERNTVLAAKGPGTKIVDLEGKALLPGFIDAHGHFSFSTLLKRTGVNLQSPPLGTLTTMGELVARLKQRAAATPKGQWVQGFSYDDTLLHEKRHPTRTDLDEVSTEHPIYLLHTSGHVAAVNSLALKQADVTKDTAPPPGGKFRRDDTTGELNGVLEESAMYVIARLLPKIQDVEMKSILAEESAYYLSRGVTTAQNGAATADDIKHLVSTWSAKMLPIRVDVWPQFQVRLAMQNQILAAPAAQELIRFTASKGFADGSIQAFTGYLGVPYHSHGLGDDHYRGYPRSSREDLTDQVVGFHKAGLQLAVHANGDAAIDDVLYAYAKAQDETPRPDARHIVVHAQMTRDDQLDKMKQLGVIPSFFNLHVYYWGDRHRDIFIGPDRAARISPMRTALDKGLRMTLHADAPVVPMDPMMIVWSAVTRQTSSGAVLGPEQRIGVDEALRAITIDAAYQGFAETNKGSLAVGKLADLVILDESPLAVSPDRLKGIKVLETVVGGQSVWPQP